MDKIVNLNKFRKRQKRASAERSAAENRVKFGRDKSEISRTRARTERAAKNLDDHRRE